MALTLVVCVAFMYSNRQCTRMAQYTSRTPLRSNQREHEFKVLFGWNRFGSLIDYITTHLLQDIFNANVKCKH